MLAAAAIGAVLGFLASMPVAGPIAALVLARGMDGRFRSGQGIAAGAAVAEGAYAFAAYYGFGAFVTAVPWIEPVTHGIGAVILVGVAIMLFRRTATPSMVAAPEEKSGTVFGAVALGFGISIANPTLLATWTAAMTFVYASGFVEFSPGSAAAFAGGTVVGTVAWFALFLFVLHHARRKFSPASMILARRLAAVLVLGLAAWFAVRLVQSMA